MANTYTQIHIHCIFAIQNRLSLITKEWREELYKYITGIVKNNGHKPLAIGGMPDHVHLLFGMRPVQALSDLMQSIKSDSSEWINKNNFVMGRFSWQEGYGAFSYSKSQLDSVIKYIEAQEQHHSKKSFVDEYRDFLKKFDVIFDDRYIFKPVAIK
ncbi:MAG: IS200/IS605 family transposase [Planctomycetaceae bacterium]|jgi:REP element-mobilizing transposase RayT|nr:IS200/IS605 family transposase [Planctomycetaceae bacterium]